MGSLRAQIGSLRVQVVFPFGASENEFSGTEGSGFPSAFCMPLGVRSPDWAVRHEAVAGGFLPIRPICRR